MVLPFNGYLFLSRAPIVAKLLYTTKWMTTLKIERSSLHPQPTNGQGKGSNRLVCASERLMAPPFQRLSSAVERIAKDCSEVNFKWCWKKCNIFRSAGICKEMGIGTVGNGIMGQNTTLDHDCTSCYLTIAFFKPILFLMNFNHMKVNILKGQLNVCKIGMIC